MKYPPLFKRIPVDNKTTGAKIAETQDKFEKFWYELNRVCDRNSEKTMAMRKMQEACHWLCRAIALDAFKPDDPNHPKPFVITEEALKAVEPSVNALEKTWKQPMKVVASNEKVLNPVLKSPLIKTKRSKLTFPEKKE